MADFDPFTMLRVFEQHRVDYIVIGGIAARIEGAPLLTEDLDITPAGDPENLGRLAAALADLDARLRVADPSSDVRFPLDAEVLATAEIWTLETNAGPLDIVFTPAGTTGYADLRRRSVAREIDERLVVQVAALADVVRSKQAAARAKDQAALPLLRETLDIRRGERGRSE